MDSALKSLVCSHFNFQILSLCWLLEEEYCIPKKKKKETLSTSFLLLSLLPSFFFWLLPFCSFVLFLAYTLLHTPPSLNKEAVVVKQADLLKVTEP